MKRSTRTFILVAALAAAALAVFFFFPASKTVTLEVLGQPITINTRARQVSGVLDEAGIVLAEGDEIVPPPDTRLKDGQTIVLSPAIQVNIWVEDSLTTLTTTDHIPAAWLAQAGIALGENDKILVNGEVQPPDRIVLYQDEVTVEVQRAHTITVQRGEEQWTLHSPAASLGQALWQAGITLSESDLLTPPAETPLTGNMTARITPGRQITVSADGETITAATSAKTVGAALAQIGLPLQGLDYSQPDEDDPLPEDGHITVVRVQEEVVINQETIPFETQFTALADVEIDNYKVSQAGQVGLKAQRQRVRYENGEEVSREVEDEWVLRDPVPRIEGYGTKIVVRTADTPDGPIEYWRKVEMYATSYSPCNSGADRCYPYTSLGYKVQKGVAAVIYDWFIPMGNHTVYVTGYGPAVIADVGGGIPGTHWIDLGYSDEDYVPWSQYVTVYFTTPIPPESEILYVLPYK